MLFYTTTMNNTECTNCPVSTGTHKPAEAVHQIAEPQPDALALAECLQKDVWQATPLRLSKVVELSAETLIAQRARIAELEKAESDLINQRDHCEEIIDRMADAVLGKDRPEWSSNYDFIDAAQEVEDHMAGLESKLDAIGAGGVEPLRKPASQQAEAIQSMGGKYRVRWKHKNGQWSGWTGLGGGLKFGDVEVELIKEEATQPAAQVKDATVLMGYMHPGNFHPHQHARWKTGAPCALRLNGWTGEPLQVAVYAKHADVDAALAAQAKQGGAA